MQFYASNWGFLITEQTKAILPVLAPAWIGGEIDFWPGAIDLTMARDAIVDNERAQEIRREIADSMTIFMKEIAHRNKGDYKRDFAQFIDTLLVYSWAYSEGAKAFNKTDATPLLTENETIHFILKLLNLMFGPRRTKTSLGEILNDLDRRRIDTIYIRRSWYPKSSAILKNIQKQLEASGNLVLNNRTLVVTFRGLDRSARVSLDAAIRPILTKRGFKLVYLENVRPEAVCGIGVESEELPKHALALLDLMAQHGNVVPVNMPQAEFVWLTDDTLYVNIANNDFEEFVSTWQRASRAAVEAYVTGLFQRKLLIKNSSRAAPPVPLPPSY